MPLFMVRFTGADPSRLKAKNRPEAMLRGGFKIVGTDYLLSTEYI